MQLRLDGGTFSKLAEVVKPAVVNVSTERRGAGRSRLEEFYAIVVGELVTWSGPGTGVVTRSIRLTPRTAIDVIRRADGTDGDRAALPGWDTRVIDAADLRRGDFVNVTTDRVRRAVAVARQVVRPELE